MQYDYFVASRWRNKDAVLELAEKIRARGKTVYTFIEGDGEAYALKDINGQLSPEEFMKHFESRHWQTDLAIREVFDIDMKALRKSKNLILLLPAGISAHIEAGVAYGLGKHTVLIGEQKEAESLYLIFNETYKSVDDFLNQF